MITISQDSEFMTNLLPANPVPAGKQFFAFQDQNSNPAVFSLGEDNILNLITTKNRITSRVDFGALCKLSGKVLAFDIQQNPDNSLSIVVATDAGGSHCNVYTLLNMLPANLLAPLPSSITFAGGTYPIVYDIFLVSPKILSPNMISDRF